MSLNATKKITFLVFTIAAAMLINSCAVLNSCDCPGLEGKITTGTIEQHS
jgi:hypothetical protein